MRDNRTNRDVYNLLRFRGIREARTIKGGVSKWSQRAREVSAQRYMYLRERKRKIKKSEILVVVVILEEERRQGPRDAGTEVERGLCRGLYEWVISTCPAWKQRLDSFRGKYRARRTDNDDCLGQLRSTSSPWREYLEPRLSRSRFVCKRAHFLRLFLRIFIGETAGGRTKPSVLLLLVSDGSSGAKPFALSSFKLVPPSTPLPPFCRLLDCYLRHAVQDRCFLSNNSAG